MLNNHCNLTFYRTVRANHSTQGAKGFLNAETGGLPKPVTSQ